jgi:hypothetical protein
LPCAALQAFNNGLCEYMAEYALYASEWEVVSTLRTMCTDGTAAARVAQAVEERDAENRKA